MGWECRRVPWLPSMNKESEKSHGIAISDLAPWDLPKVSEVDPLAVPLYNFRGNAKQSNGVASAGVVLLSRSPERPEQ